MLQLLRSTLLSVSLVGSAALSGPHAAPPVPQGANTGQETAPADPIDWFRGSYEAARRSAGKSDRPMFVYFWMDGSEHCKRLYQQTLCTDGAAQELTGYLCFSASASDPAGAAVVGRHGVRTLPTMLFLNPDGTVEDGIVGDIGLPAFQGELNRIRSGTDTVSDLRAKVRAAPDDLDLRFRLADKLSYVGYAAESQELLDSIKRDDPRGETVVGAQLHLYDVMNGIPRKASDPSDPTTFDLAPMYAHVAKIRPRPVRFEAWQWLTNVERQRGDTKKVRHALMETWEHVAEADELFFGRELLRNFWQMRDELERRERTFALKVAEVTSKKALAWLEADPPPTRADLGEGFEGDVNAYVADQLDGLACAYFLNGKRKKAITTVKRSLQLDPGVPAHQTLLDLFQAKKR